MAEEFQESLLSFNSRSTLRCSDIFSCSTAVNAGETGETFGCFPATTDLFELSKTNSSDNSPHLSSLDLFSSSIDWSQSLLELSDASFEAALLEERPTTKQCEILMDSSIFPSDQTLKESAVDDFQLILPQFGFPSNSSMFWSTKSNPAYVIYGSNPTAKESSNTASIESMLPTAKKLRIETPSPLPTFKVRKEKLGDRITALQQLVSPFGKTDTASVLHEAIEYIKFLHEQLNGLSNPYLRNEYQRTNQQILERQTKNGECSKKDLRSRGLCLVPISTTFSVASYEISPVDFWTQLWRNLRKGETEEPKGGNGEVHNSYS